MKQDKVYLIYRVHDPSIMRYSKKNLEYYGWSDSKIVVKAFLNQRTQGKYKSIKSNIEEVEDITQTLSENKEINFIKILSSKSKKEFTFFLTSSELMEIEMRIQKLFVDQSSILNLTKEGELIYNYCEAIMNLKKKYADALDIVGFQPPEIAELLDGDNSYGEEYESFSDEMRRAYEHKEDYEDYVKRKNRLPGSVLYLDVCRKVIYSLESFVKVCRDSF